MHRRDARAKLICGLILVVIMISTPLAAPGSWIGYMALLLTAWRCSRIPAGYIFKRTLILAPFILLTGVFLPFVTAGLPEHQIVTWRSWHFSQPGLERLAGLLLKSFLALTGLLLLSATTPFNQLLQAMRQFKIPQTFITLTEFTYRYHVVLIDELEHMKRACDCRGFVPRWLWQARTIGQLIGTLFLRSYERAERIHQAMMARGYTGQIAAQAPLRLALGDRLFIIGCCGMIVLFRLWGAL